MNDRELQRITENRRERAEKFKFPTLLHDIQNDPKTTPNDPKTTPNDPLVLERDLNAGKSHSIEQCVQRIIPHIKNLSFLDKIPTYIRHVLVSTVRQQ